MRKSELKIQAEACSYIWQHLPQTRYCLYHIANEAQRSQIEWGQLKAAGFIKGAQDLHFCWNGKTYRIEVKAEGGQIDPWQKVVHKAHAMQYQITYVLWSSEDIIHFVSDIVNGNISWSVWETHMSPYCKTDIPLSNWVTDAVISDCIKRRKHTSDCQYCSWKPGWRQITL